jgi:hypothetical protein
VLLNVGWVSIDKPNYEMHRATSYTTAQSTVTKDFCESTSIPLQQQLVAILIERENGPQSIMSPANKISTEREHELQEGMRLHDLSGPIEMASIKDEMDQTSLSSVPITVMPIKDEMDLSVNSLTPRSGMAIKDERTIHEC